MEYLMFLITRLSLLSILGGFRTRSTTCGTFCSKKWWCPSFLGVRNGGWLVANFKSNLLVDFVTDVAHPLIGRITVSGIDIMIMMRQQHYLWRHYKQSVEQSVKNQHISRHARRFFWLYALLTHVRLYTSHTILIYHRSVATSVVHVHMIICVVALIALNIHRWF